MNDLFDGAIGHLVVTRRVREAISIGDRFAAAAKEFSQNRAKQWICRRANR